MRRNHLLQLLHDNRGPFTPIQARIVQAAAGTGEATVYLYDPIVGDRMTAEWYGGVCPQDFVPAFAAIQADTIRLRINCGGGDVFAAEAMCQAIRDQKAHVIAQVEGLAASAATVITSACDEVLITANSKFMVHESWTFAWGNKRDMAQTIELLAKADQTMFEEYVRKTGATMDQVVAWCEAETWFTGQEAVDAKFADALVNGGDTGSKASARAQWRLDAYAKAPTPVAERPRAPRQEISDKLTARQSDLYTAFEDVAEKYGKFDTTSGAAGAHYMQPSPFAAEGLQCANCALYTGARACEVVAGDISPDAVCKFWIIPEQLITRRAPGATAGTAPNNPAACTGAAEDEQRRIRREHALRAMRVRSLIE